MELPTLNPRLPLLALLANIPELGECPLCADTVAKVFLTARRNFLGPLVRSARRDVMTSSFHTKTTRGRRIGPTGPCSSGNIGDSTLAIFSEFFDSRLLQQYPPKPDIQN
jgi:hypothetical protein